MRWLRFETAGSPGEPGVSLQLRSAANDRLLAEIKPTRVPGDTWRTAFVPAPAEAYRIVAIDRDPDRWLGFSGPAAMGGLSFLAWQATRHAPLMLGVFAAATPSSPWRRSSAKGGDNSLSRLAGLGESRVAA